MFNPISESKIIFNQYARYLLSNYKIKHADLEKEYEYCVHHYLSKGPYIELNDIFETSSSLKELVDKGLLSKLWLNLEKEKNGKYLEADLYRKQYKHQVDAYEMLISKKENAIITTGTGSGKTECFLYPIIDSLLKEIEAGTLNKEQGGIRAIIVFPMNALANDQVKRIRNLLAKYDKITFGVYNGQTVSADKKKDAIASYNDANRDDSNPFIQKVLSNEIIDRGTMEKCPPNILITNHVMLEQLIFNPIYEPVFKHANVHYIVLDEAHTYRGSAGIEMSYLLNRVEATLGSKGNIQYILTSATLGEKNTDEDEIAEFGRNLTGHLFSKENIVFGTRVKREKEEIRYRNNNVFNQLASAIDTVHDDKELGRKIKEIFINEKIEWDDGIDYRANLYNLCSHSELYDVLRSNYKISCLAEDLLDSMRKEINDLDPDLLNNFVVICNYSLNNSGSQLVYCRYHYFVNNPNALYLYFDKNGKRHVEMNIEKLVDVDSMIFEVFHCKKDGCGTLYIKSTDGELDERTFLGMFNIDPSTATVNYEICDEEEQLNDAEFTYRYINYEDGKVHINDDGHSFLVKISLDEDREPKKCFECGGEIMSFAAGGYVGTSVVADGIFDRLPYYIKRKNGLDYRYGKQFITFSDSRSSASKFAVNFEEFHRQIVGKREYYETIENYFKFELEDSQSISCFIKNLKKKIRNDRIFADSFSDLNNEPNDIQREINDLASYIIIEDLVHCFYNNSLSSLGMVHYEYKGIGDDIVSKVSQIYAVDKVFAREVLNTLVLTIVESGCISGESCNLNLDEDDYLSIFHSSKQNFIAETKRDDINNVNIHGFACTNYPGKEDVFYLNDRLKIVMKAFKINKTDANQFLKDFFSYLKGDSQNSTNVKLIMGHGDYYSVDIGNIYISTDIGKNGKYHLYTCPYCDTKSYYHFENGECISPACDSHDTFEIENVSEFFKNNHYYNRYKEVPEMPLVIEEHTAQLSGENASNYQKRFLDNDINVLSSSTTFEMGVDLGSLETVFMRDVPPTPANYIQRAGRAGRSKNSVSYVVTYCGSNSHDAYYFQHASDLVNGKAKPPVFDVCNKKLIQRQINATCLSYFFKHNVSTIDHGIDKLTDRFFMNGGLYDSFKQMLLSIRSNNELKDFLSKSFSSLNSSKDSLHKATFDWIISYEWLNDLFGKENTVNAMSIDLIALAYRNEVDSIEKQLENDKNNEFLKKNLARLKGQSFIDLLSHKGILPRYGFPVDVYELAVNNFTKDQGGKETVDLSRDAIKGIKEYAPGCQVVANKYLYTSRYINPSIVDGKSSFNFKKFVKCNCGAINEVPLDEEKCITCYDCGCEIDLEKAKITTFLVPENGFSSESGKLTKARGAMAIGLANQPLTNTICYSDQGEQINSIQKTINGYHISLTHSINVPFRVFTCNNDYYICPNCGYTFISTEVDAQKLGINKKEANILKNNKAIHPDYIESSKDENEPTHLTKYGTKCYCHRFEKVTLLYPFVSDVVLVDLTEVLEEYSNDRKFAVSFKYAFLDGIAQVLQIERSNIDAIILKLNKKIAFYDCTPGGTGYVKRILIKNNFEKIIDFAYEKMSACSCKTACYNCLLNYNNQQDIKYLDRHCAIEILEKLTENKR